MKERSLILLVIICSIFTLNINLREVEVAAKGNKLVDIVYGCVTDDSGLYDKNGNLIGKLEVGDMIIIKGKVEGSSKIIDKKTGINGYIASNRYKEIVSGNNENFKKINVIGKIKNVESEVNVRSLGSIESESIEKLKNGREVEVVGKVDDWYKVKMGKEIGYIYGEYVDIN